MILFILVQSPPDLCSLKNSNLLTTVWFFSQDELTLIIVGAVLGGLAGFGQTFFY